MPTPNNLRLCMLIRGRHLAVFAVIVLLGVVALWLAAPTSAWQAAVPRLVEQVVDPNFGIGYAITVADINRDR